MEQDLKEFKDILYNEKKNNILIREENERLVEKINNLLLNTKKNQDI